MPSRRKWCRSCLARRAERPAGSREHVHRLIVENKREGVKAGVRAMMDRGDSTPLLGKVDVPALVVHGTEDTLIPPSEAEGMHKAIRHPQLELMPSAGHLLDLEQPSSFDARLWKFLVSYENDIKRIRRHRPS